MHRHILGTEDQCGQDYMTEGKNGTNVVAGAQRYKIMQDHIDRGYQILPKFASFL